MSQLYDSLFQRIFELENDQVLIVSPNQRLALELSRGYDRWQLRQNLEYWSPLRTQAFDGWIQHMWSQWLDESSFLSFATKSSNNAQINPVNWQLLDPVQELTLWEVVIAESEVGQTLLRVKGCAKLAMSAHQLLQEWGAGVDALDDQIQQFAHLHSLDIQAFLQWRQAFCESCEEQGWLTKADLIQHLISKYQQGDHDLPYQQIYFVGHEELSPLQQNLLQALKTCGVKIDEFSPSTSDSSNLPKLYQFDKAEDEWRAAAQWAANFVYPNGMDAAFTTAQDSLTKVAVIVPELQQVKIPLKQVLAEELVPQFQKSLLPVNTRPYFNLSAGDPLSQFPLVRSALNLMEWHLHPLETATVLDLCNSPFLRAADPELAQRALLKSSIFDSGAKTISLARFRQLALSAKTFSVGENPEQQVEHLLLPELVQCLKQVDGVDIKKGKHSHAYWRATLESLLAAWGWPGDRTLSSDEYQQHNKWMGILDGFCELDVINSSVTFAQALTSLRRLLDETVFQAQSENQSIHVLGLLEALGQSFDAVWIVGLNDETWPAAPNPNPFIPYNIQSENDFPRATAARELRFAQNIMKKLLAYYPQVNFSWSSAEGDKPLQPSALLSPWLVSAEKRSAEQVEGEQLNASSALEKVEDSFIAVADAAGVRGGAGILKTQAECPFKAFARYRLLAEPHPEWELGLSGAEKGELIHSVLEQFWQRCKTQKELMQLGTDSLQSILAITVDKALDKIQRHDSPLLVKERFLALEKERLVRLALAWLEHEKQRPDFEVLAVEQQNTTTVAGLPLKLRIDRIDRLPNGQYLIIDYKTGTVTQKDWQGDDLKEPQLPLYCLMDRDKVSGIAFAQVRLGSEKLKGMADESSASVLPEKDMDLEGQWDIQIDHWDQQLQRLAQDFLQGYAAVKPASGLAKKECEFCPYPNLCRVGESA